MNVTDAMYPRGQDAVSILCAHRPRHVGKNLTEDDILYLQNAFMTHGLHHVCLSDIVSGRDLVMLLMRALNYYDRVACITTVQNPRLQKPIRDVYAELVHEGISSATSMEQFFVDSFDADFLWVEATHLLMCAPLFGWFLRALETCGIAHRIPIIALSYHDGDHSMH